MNWTDKLNSLLNRNIANKIHLVFLYRIISLSLTSFFFLLGPTNSPIFFKLFMILSLGITAWIVTDLQRKHIGKNSLKAVVFTETIGLMFILIPTGGIESPFIWYALNPVLVAASFLTPLICWGVLTFYLGSATIIASFIFPFKNFFELLSENSSVYLVCLLTTFLVMLFSALTKELDLKASILKKQQNELIIVNNKLSETNELYKETLEHIMSLYHLMDSFSTNKSIEKLTTNITSALMNCTQKSSVFFWLADLDFKKSYISNTTNNKNLEKMLILDWHILRQNRTSFNHDFNHENYWLKMIRTSKNVGVLGIKMNHEEEKNSLLLIRTFEFIADLSEIMLERIHMDQMMDQLIVIEEQNRIANEIHDNVSQKLFGIVYSLHTLQKTSSHLSKEDLNKEYEFLSMTANATMKELRAAIYRLSSMKKGEKPFLQLVKNYLEEYAKLNNIKIEYQFFGDETIIPKILKAQLYRIICEACGNSVRHGECSIIDIKLFLLEDNISLTIHDDGAGLKYQNEKRKLEKGIGLINMKNIVYSFGGSFSLKSILNEGTTLQIDIPNNPMLKKQEVNNF